MGNYDSAFPSNPTPVPPVPVIPKPKSKVIVTAGQARKSFNKHSSNLDAILKSLGLNDPAMNPGTGTGATTTKAVEGEDSIISGLNSLRTQNDAATNSLIASTQAAYQNSINKAQKQGDNYKAGLQLLGIQSNAATFSPDLLSSHITEAANETMDKVNSLKSEEAKLLMDAQTARSKNQLSTLEAIMNRQEQIKEEKNKVLKDLNDRMVEGQKQVVFDSPALFKAFGGLNEEDKGKFIIAVAKKYGVSPVSVQSALMNEKVDVDKRNKVGTGTGSGKLTVKSASSYIDGLIKNGVEVNGKKVPLLGADGYMSPENWTDAYDNWLKNGLPESTFLKLYKKYLNPEAYEKAGISSPKSSSSSDRTG